MLSPITCSILFFYVFSSNFDSHQQTLAFASILSNQGHCSQLSHRFHFEFHLLKGLQSLEKQLRDWGTNLDMRIVRCYEKTISLHNMFLLFASIYDQSSSLQRPLVRLNHLKPGRWISHDADTSKNSLYIVELLWILIPNLIDKLDTPMWWTNWEIVVGFRPCGTTFLRGSITSNQIFRFCICIKEPKVKVLNND